MSNTGIEKFETLWTNFETRVKGKLMTIQKNQTISTSLANLILTDLALSWASDIEINGRWLNSLTEENPTKAAMIKSILMKDMHFDPIEKPSSYESTNILQYIIPCAGAGVGYIASRFFEVNSLGQAAFILIPALASYPVAKNIVTNKKQLVAQQEIDLYIEQLAKYKSSVISILQQEY